MNFDWESEDTRDIAEQNVNRIILVLSGIRHIETSSGYYTTPFNTFSPVQHDLCVLVPHSRIKKSVDVIGA